MTTNKEKPEDKRPAAPFPTPAKNMSADPSTHEMDGTRNASRAPGHKTLDRKDEAAPTDEGKDASGPAKDSEPNQSRELNRDRH